METGLTLIFITKSALVKCMDTAVVKACSCTLHLSSSWDCQRKSLQTSVPTCHSNLVRFLLARHCNCLMYLMLSQPDPATRSSILNHIHYITVQRQSQQKQRSVLGLLAHLLKIRLKIRLLTFWSCRPLVLGIFWTFGLANLWSSKPSVSLDAPTFSNTQWPNALMQHRSYAFVLWWIVTVTYLGQIPFVILPTSFLADCTFVLYSIGFHCFSFQRM